MEILLIILILLKDDGETMPKLKKAIKTILDNKEIISAFLSDGGNEPEKKEPPPEKQEAVNSALKNFLDQYVR